LSTAREKPAGQCRKRESADVIHFLYVYSCACFRNTVFKYLPNVLVSARIPGEFKYIKPAVMMLPSSFIGIRLVQYTVVGQRRLIVETNCSIYKRSHVY